jgi:hypothetical protein
MGWQTPFYCRPLNHRYAIRSEAGYSWWTGITRDDRQLLVSRNGTLIFDRDGHLRTVAGENEYPIPAEWRDGPASAVCGVEWPRTVEFEECPILVRRFWLPERWLGVEDLPELLAEYFTDPTAFFAKPWNEAEDALSWRDSGMYVFHCGCDYHMSSRGDVVSS